MYIYLVVNDCVSVDLGYYIHIRCYMCTKVTVHYMCYITDYAGYSLELYLKAAYNFDCRYISHELVRSQWDIVYFFKVRHFWIQTNYIQLHCLIHIPLRKEKNEWLPPGLYNILAKAEQLLAYTTHTHTQRTSSTTK